MAFLQEKTIGCPYCGELMSVLIDPPLEIAEALGAVDEVEDASLNKQLPGHEYSQEYIEDCQVCCRPIVLKVACDIDGELFVEVFSENE